MNDIVKPHSEQSRAVTLAGIPAFAMAEAELITALESSLYPGAKPESIKLVVNICRAQLLDPFQKPYHIVPMSVRKAGAKRDDDDQYEWRDVIMPGVGLYRIQAARTGAYAGVDEGVFGPDVTKKLGEKEFTFPEWCSVTVYRIVQGMRVSFSSGKVYWEETYATVKATSITPNRMWAKRSYGQIEKCAEALALRRGFPEIGAQPTAEEMEGRVIDSETGDVIRGEPKQIKQPTPKSPKPPIEGKSTRTTEGENEADQHAASDGQVSWLKNKLTGEEGGPTQAECLKFLKREKFEGLTVAEWKRAKEWIKDPTGAEATA